MAADDGAAMPPLAPTRADNRSDWPSLLRRYRSAASTRLIWRDVARPRRRRCDAGRKHRTRRNLPAIGARRAGSRIRAALRHGARGRRHRAATGRVRPRQARRRRAEFLLRRRPGLRLSAGRRERRRACARRRGLLRPPRPATREAARRSHRRRFLPSRRPAPASVRQRRARRAAVRGDGVSISSAKAATGNATPGRRRGRSRATARPASASCRPCGRSCIAATSTTARSTACAR